MKKQFAAFVVRWLLNSLALWIALRLVGQESAFGNNTAAFLIAGLLLSVVNSVLKPIVVIFALPAILLSLGLFMLVVNGLMVYIAIALAPNLHIGFGGAILAGMIVSLTNYVLSGILELNQTSLRGK